MATLQASSFLFSSSSRPSCCQRGVTRAALSIPKVRPTSFSTRGLVEELELLRSGDYPSSSSTTKSPSTIADPMVLAKLYALMEAVADRVEMHKNIGEQRNNWNSLLLTSINTITLAAATMAGIAATSVAAGSPLTGLKLASTLMYLGATGMLVIMNKIQPSQLAEEQRNAARLFQQLHGELQTTIAIGNPTTSDVKEAMDKVLALDQAYPLPLIGKMLEKFPSRVEPAVWWPQRRQRSQVKGLGRKIGNNGWNANLEEELKEVVKVLRKNDRADYLRLGEKAVKLNKALAISGPLLTGLAAVGTALMGSPSHDSWAVVLGVVGGALASVVNTFQHGGQVGMVFEMYRSNAGFFKLMEESIEANLKEREVERRENGELFEMKVALQLGRSLSELKDLADSSIREGNDIEEFGSKLF
ncbi:hypothetical protein RJ639_046078 [Escallonia herrerae]|uniref:Uncharacterized protein n=1 Tax=Escallonia herrerae TaxID=1293975 RepID=A0AA88W6H4_9ASTE|nr:hypothetical protein RJ639_046078 [Escallonia herrerae]